MKDRFLNKGPSLHPGLAEWGDRSDRCMLHDTKDSWTVPVPRIAISNLYRKYRMRNMPPCMSVFDHKTPGIAPDFPHGHTRQTSPCPNAHDSTQQHRTHHERYSMERQLENSRISVHCHRRQVAICLGSGATKVDSIAFGRSFVVLLFQEHLGYHQTHIEIILSLYK